MLLELTRNSGALDGLGKGSGGGSAGGLLQQHCRRPETLRDRKDSTNTTAISHPGYT